MSDGVLEPECVCVCVFFNEYVCVCHTHGLASFPFLLATLQHVGERTGVPLENDKVVARQVSTFINTTTLIVQKYGLIWHELANHNFNIPLYGVTLKRLTQSRGVTK